MQAVDSLRPTTTNAPGCWTAMLVAGGLGLVLAVLAGAWFARRAVRPLAAALALQRRFVADASHELRTPLTLLSTRTQLLRRHLRRGADADELTGEVDGVVTDARQLADILDDLLLAADTRGCGGRRRSTWSRWWVRSRRPAPPRPASGPWRCWCGVTSRRCR